MKQRRRNSLYFNGSYQNYNSIECENAVCIPLTKGFHTIIDADDFDLIAPFRWCVDKANYAYNGKKKMHWLIMKTPKGMVTDHASMDKLDNRKCNLRVCTHSMNKANVKKPITKNPSSKYKGVRSHAHTKRFSATICVNKKAVHIGYFDTQEQAAEAYNQAAEKYFREYAYKNIINSKQG